MRMRSFIFVDSDVYQRDHKRQRKAESHDFYSCVESVPVKESQIILHFPEG